MLIERCQQISAIVLILVSASVNIHLLLVEVDDDRAHRVGCHQALICI